MVCRIATFNQKLDVDVDSEKMRAFRRWMSSQPGFETAFHVEDPKTGRCLSISFWESQAHLVAMKDRVPPGGAVGLMADTVEVFTVVREF